ncbi:MAG: NAD(P)-binding protein [Pseudomonadales bacterium]
MNPECPNTNRRNALRIRQSKLAKKFMDIQSKQSKVLPRIAIIGAGMAGLSLANLLENHADTTLFEKSAGVGGRMSTRYAGAYQFDHGAQYFTARSKAFQGFLAPMLATGVVRAWQPSVLTLGGDKKPYKRDWFRKPLCHRPQNEPAGQSVGEGKNLLLKTEIAEIQQCEPGLVATRHGKLPSIL